MSLALVYCARLALVVLGFVLKQVHGERVAVQAFKSFCFFDDLKANEPWGVQFQSDELPIRAIVSFLFPLQALKLIILAL